MLDKEQIENWDEGFLGVPFETFTCIRCYVDYVRLPLDKSTDTCPRCENGDKDGNDN